ncbi:Rrf2 family transcriptional regulator [Mollicutes bacterium LVI A0078]|nr:Rrf2 family transcriptional regulator [Mollicutes bacterium LVI A0075]WOO91541.1 Rrf2 family transcriptional regulator [Mollicutes bacterium LVI A0078]
MKLTNATEKALAVVAMLSTQEDNKPIPSSVIVERLHISDSYTKKLLRKLVVGNVITSVPGNSGGFSLNRDLKEINILEIVEAIEGTVVTYPGYGTLEHAFTEFPEQIEHGEHVIKDVFAKADKLWRDELQAQTLDKVFLQSFGDREVVVDWLDL